MKIKYQDEEYTLVRENSGREFVLLTFANKNAAGVSLVNYRYFTNLTEMEIDWMYLPYTTMKELQEK